MLEIIGVFSSTLKSHSGELLAEHGFLSFIHCWECQASSLNALRKNIRVKVCWATWAWSRDWRKKKKKAGVWRQSHGTDSQVFLTWEKCPPLTNVFPKLQMKILTVSPTERIPLSKTQWLASYSFEWILGSWPLPDFQHHPGCSVFSPLYIHMQRLMPRSLKLSDLPRFFQALYPLTVQVLTNNDSHYAWVLLRYHMLVQHSVTGYCQWELVICYS